MSIRSFLEDRGVSYNHLSQDTKFYAFIGWLADMGKITMEDYHHYFGLRNNIPECCIKFFIECRNEGVEPYATSLSCGQPPGLNYAMCPKCIEEYHARIHKTDNICSGSHNDDNPGRKESFRSTGSRTGLCYGKKRSAHSNKH